MIGLTANAQDKKVRKRNDFTVAATEAMTIPSCRTLCRGNQYSYSLPVKSTNWNDKDLRVGIEGGWFFLDEWNWYWEAA